MARRLTKVDFAEIWGRVSRLSEKDWNDIVELKTRAVADSKAAAFVRRVGKSAKPRPEAGGEKT